MRLNTTANTFIRAPSESIGTFALESAMDELAYELGMDPVGCSYGMIPKEILPRGQNFRPVT